MGLDVYGNLIIGIVVSRSDFFKEVGSEWRCLKGNHPRPDGSSAKFCEHCGNEFHERPMEEPTAKFKAWAESKKYSPDRWLDVLHDTYDCGFGIHCVDSVSSSDSRESFALGFKVAETDSQRGGRAASLYGLSLEFITAKMAEVEEKVGNLGINRKAQVFLNVHMSY
jgi:hypothetical protein